MADAAIVCALAAAGLFGTALVLTQLGLRHMTPLAGAAVSIPCSALLFIAAAPFALAGETPQWPAVPLFAAVGVFFPAVVTLLTFEANRLIGPVITGAVGNLAPAFAVGLAVLVLAEPLRWSQLAALVAVAVGVVAMSGGRATAGGQWRVVYLALPLVAAAIRGAVQPAIKVALAVWPSPFAASLTGYIVSALIVLAAITLRTGRPLRSASAAGRLWFVAVGLCNGLAVLSMYAALARGAVAVVSPLVATYPLVTVVLSAIVFGHVETSRRMIAGAALTVAGAVLTVAGAVLLIVG